MKDTISTEDVRSLLTWLTETGANYTLAGGLAVSLWAENILSEEEKRHFKLPLHSRDMDFRGQRFLAEGIKAWFRDNEIESSQLTVATRKNAPQAGKIFNLPFRPSSSKASIQATANIEVLERLPLLDSTIEQQPNGTRLALRGINVLDPFSLLVCKLHAYHTRPPNENGKDLAHILILSLVIQKMSAKKSSSGYNAAEDAKRLLAIIGEGKFPLPLGEKETEDLLNSIKAAAGRFGQ